MARFENRNIVVTGAARGMGAEEARQLVQEGARVVLCDVLKEEGETLAKELGPKATFLFHDVTNEQHWNALAEHVQAAGGLDGLVNNAGIFNPQPISETTAESFNRHMQINQLGCFLGIKFADQTVGKNGASIVTFGIPTENRRLTRKVR